MGMPKLLKSVEKVDDYTVKITLNKPEAPFLADLAMPYRRRSSRRNTPIAMLKAGTPEKIDQEPIGTGPFYLVQYQKDAVDPLQGVPAILGRQGQDRRPGLRDHAGCLGALGQAAEGRMPRDALSEPGRPRRDPQGPERHGAGAARPQRRLSRLQHAEEAVRRRARAQGHQHGDQQEGDHRRASICRTGVAAKNPIPPTMWSYNDAIKDDPVRPGGGQEAAGRGRLPERLRRPTCGRCRCSAPTTRTPSASPS